MSSPKSAIRVRLKWFIIYLGIRKLSARASSQSVFDKNLLRILTCCLKDTKIFTKEANELEHAECQAKRK